MFKLRVLRLGHYPGPYMQSQMSFETGRGHHTQRRLCEGRAERNLKMLALKIGVMWPQDKECQSPPEVGRGKERILS